MASLDHQERMLEHFEKQAAKAPSGFEVLAERCDQCLYGTNKIVSNDRRREIIQGINGRDQYFVCHKASIAGRNVACRGDWDQRGCGQLGRIAERLNAVSFVPESEL